MKIKFLRDYVVRDEAEGTENQTVYKEGQVKDFNDASARHFINRSAAEEVTAKKPVSKTAAKKEEE